MAFSDYMLCEGCDGKLVYDANWYEQAANKIVVGLCEGCIAKGWAIIVRDPRGLEYDEKALPRDSEGCPT